MPPWTTIFWFISTAGDSLIVPFDTTIWQWASDKAGLCIWRNVYVQPVPTTAIGEPLLFMSPVAGVYSAHMKVSKGDRLYANVTPAGPFTCDLAITCDSPQVPTVDD